MTSGLVLMYVSEIGKSFTLSNKFLILYLFLSFKFLLVFSILSKGNNRLARDTYIIDFIMIVSG